MENPSFVIILSAWLTPVVAIFGIWFTWRQYSLDQKKRKDELFDRRWDFYRRAKTEFIDNFCDFYEGKDLKAAKKIVKNWIDHYADEAYFLFGPEIEKHVRASVKDVINRTGNNQIEDPAATFRKPFEKYLRLK